MTNIQDTLTYADGSLPNGDVVVSWPMFQTNGVPVANGQERYPVVNGQIQLTLYPNVNALPSGTYYTATFELDEGAVYSEYWIVPNLTTVTLAQIRATFPPAPGLLINASQLSSAGAQAGQFLGWNGSQWVPMYVTTLNVSPNTIGLNVTANAASNISVVGSPAVLGSVLTLNIPDAGAAARGVVNTAVQSFAGAKTFVNAVTFDSTATFAPVSGVTNAWGEAWFGTANNFHLGGGLILATPDGSPAILTADQAVLKYANLSSGVLSPALPAGAVTIPGTETIRLPTGPSYSHGIGVDGADNLWLGTASSTASSFAYLRPDFAWVANWIDMSPYQHPVTANTEASPNQASVVLYKDSTQWAGMGYDTNMRIWFRLGPNASGTYYYFASGGQSFDSSYYVNNTLIAREQGINLIGGTNVTIVGSDNPANSRVDVSFSVSAVPMSRQIIPGTGLTNTPPGTDLSQDRTWSVVPDTTTQRVEGALSGGLIGVRKQLNFVTSPSMIWNITDNATDNRLDISASFTGSGVVGSVNIAVNGTFVGTESGLNLIAGSGMTIAGVDNAGAGRVDVTFQMGTPPPAVISASQTPWLQDINAAGYRLFNTGRVLIGTTVDDNSSQLQIVAPSGYPVLAESNAGVCGSQYWSYSGTSPNNGVIFYCRAARGAIGSPAATQSGDRLMGIWGDGYDGAYVTSGAGQINIDADGNFGNASWPTRLSFITTPVGSGSGQGIERMRITNAGLVGIGTISPTYTLDTKGDCNISGIYRINGTPITSAMQTPWLQNINAAGYQLLDVGNIAIGTTVTPAYLLDIRGPTFANTAQIHLGQTTADDGAYLICVGSSDAVLSAGIAYVNGAWAVKSSNPWGFLTLGNGTFEVTLGSTATVGAPAIHIATTGQIGVAGNTTPFSRISFGSTSANSASRIAFYEGSDGSACRGIGMINPFGAAYGVGVWAISPAGVAVTDSNYNTYFADNGNVLIGPAYYEPVCPLDTGNSAAPIKISASTQGGPTCYGIGYGSGILTFGAGINPTTGTPQMVLNSNGRLGINTSTPQHPLHIIAAGTGPQIVARFANSDTSATSEARLVFDEGGNWWQGIGAPYVNSTSQALTFSVSSTANTWAERMRIIAAGNVLVGLAAVDSTGCKLQVSGGISNNNAVVSAVSDIRLKRDIEPYTAGLAAVLGVNPIRFAYNGKGGTTDGARWVSIDAQAHRDVIPDAIVRYEGDLDGEPTELYNFSLQPLVMTMVNAIKELSARLEKFEKGK